MAPGKPWLCANYVLHAPLETRIYPQAMQIPRGPGGHVSRVCLIPAHRAAPTGDTALCHSARSTLVAIPWLRYCVNIPRQDLVQ
jgi:hypothetical protein